jgi:Ca-activated chloride channel homolog
VSFASPVWLAALILVPLALGAYVLAGRRARRFAVRFPATPTLVLAAAGRRAWQRHLPAALVLAAIASLSVAMARPHRTVRVAIERASIVLVTDHSGSMQANDVNPTRLAAAQAAAEKFIDEVPAPVRIGAVAFAEQPDAVQAPSTDHGAARAVIERQTALGATATGDALAVALDLLRQGNSDRSPAAIVLLSDGATTAGRDPLDVARQARTQRVPIYTVALGKVDTVVPSPSGFGTPLVAAPDLATLREIARTTHATAYTADDADRLGAIYRRLGSRLGSHVQQHEISAAFAIGGLVLLLGAAGLSLRSAGRLP